MKNKQLLQSLLLQYPKNEECLYTFLEQEESKEIAKKEEINKV